MANGRDLTEYVTWKRENAWYSDSNVRRARRFHGDIPGWAGLRGKDGWDAKLVMEAAQGA